MTGNDIKSRCGEISRSAGSKCAFSQDNVLGFIDTSSRLDGSRGIAFFADGLVVNIGGYARGIPYGDIRSVTVAESFEDSFADELIISGIDSEIRISDYSVDKVKLKRLIDDICTGGIIEENNIEIPNNLTEFQQENVAENNENLGQNNGQISSENVAENSTENVVENNVEIPNNLTEFQQENVAEINGNLTPNNGQIPSENVAVNSANFEQENVNEIPVISEQNYDEFSKEFPQENLPQNNAENYRENERSFTEKSEHNYNEFPQENIPKNNAENQRNFYEKAEDFFIDENSRFTSVKVIPPAANNFTFETVYDDDFDEQAELEKISAMSHEQTLDYLADAFAEINGDNDKNYADNFTDEVFDEPKTQIQPDYNVRNFTNAAFIEPKTQIQPPAQEKTESALNYPAGETLTAEPMWGDIYIKASRSLRELCEQGKLSMEKIREELRERLLSSAEAFVQITADEAKIPKVLMPRITELRSAAKNYGEYFSYGEDIGTRAMFFMMFQMLSYADRIVEDPVAKDRLNDFFRRFGSAGIILSMLDMRV